MKSEISGKHNLLSVGVHQKQQEDEIVGESKFSKSSFQFSIPYIIIYDKDKVESTLESRSNLIQQFKPLSQFSTIFLLTWNEWWELKKSKLWEIFNLNANIKNRIFCFSGCDVIRSCCNSSSLPLTCVIIPISTLFTCSSRGFEGWSSVAAAVVQCNLIYDTKMKSLCAERKSRASHNSERIIIIWRNWKISNSTTRIRVLRTFFFILSL